MRFLPASRIVYRLFAAVWRYAMSDMRLAIGDKRLAVRIQRIVETTSVKADH
jgi:hypothetical protein